jgi:predicted ATP-dependent serine protease
MEQQIEDIDFTNEDTVTGNSEINKLTSEIKHLENMLKYPLGFKALIAGSLLGYFATKKLSKNNNLSIAAALAGGYAAFNFSKGKVMSNEQKHSINELIQERVKRLKTLGVEIKAETTGILGAHEIENMDYDKYIFGDDQYGNFIGDPAVGFHGIVFGLPKGGKSIWSMQFANYLANHFGKVLYIASEEGFKGTISQKIKEWTDNRTDLDFGNFTGYDEIKDKVSGYDFVFIDSLDFAKITVDEMEDLKSDNPEISFVTIKQVTKDGKFRGSQEYAHNCDIIVEIIDGVAHQKGRYSPASEMSVFDKPETNE